MDFELFSEVNMVYDRLHGLDIARQKPRQNPDMTEPGDIAASEENVLHSLAKKTPKEHKIENAQRLTGFAVGAGSMLAVQAITHPFVVFSRQCQVNHNAQRYHLTPFSVFQILMKLEQKQTDRIKKGHSVLDKLKDGLYRLVGWNRSSGGHGRLLPMWTIGVPTVLYGLLHYIIETCVQHCILVSMRQVGLYGGSLVESEDNPNPPNDMTQSYYPELVANFMAFVIPDVILYPCGTVLNRLYVQGTRTIIDELDNGYDVVPLSTNYIGMMDCCTTIWREEGVLGFYRGFGALVIQFVIYLIVLKITKFIYVTLSKDFKGKQS
ncbi:hypothetical protein QZH41_016795 [Actinostola sp. cb2023]|nr:hypothetical protein QZH41_016795 [Actinostola sp. cb2023]